jgi:hypothetical protein
MAVVTKIKLIRTRLGLQFLKKKKHGLITKKSLIIDVFKLVLF